MCTLDGEGRAMAKFVHDGRIVDLNDKTVIAINETGQSTFSVKQPY